MIWRCDMVPQYLQFRDDILKAMDRVMHSGRYILAEEVSAFEREFSDYLGGGHAVGLANATDALTLCLRAFDVGPGDEVITTPYTAIPTLSAIIDSGAKPVFVDIDPDTYLLDIQAVCQHITERTKAVVPVHIFGNVLDVHRLRSMIGPKIVVIEDAAQAHGSTFRGQKAGTMGDAGVFSFYPTKNLGGYGDGGAAVFSNPEMSSRLRLLRMYGMIDKDQICMHGVNSRLDELQAAVLRIKLPHLDDMNRRRNQIAERYAAELSFDIFRQQVIPSGVFSNYHVHVARFLGDRDAFVSHMDRAGIQTNIYYVLPLHLQAACSGLGGIQGQFPNAEALCDQAIALPMYPELPDATVDAIIKAANSFVSHD